MPDRRVVVHFRRISWCHLMPEAAFVFQTRPISDHLFASSAKTWLLRERHRLTDGRFPGCVLARKNMSLSWRLDSIEPALVRASKSHALETNRLW